MVAVNNFDVNDIHCLEFKITLLHPCANTSHHIRLIAQFAPSCALSACSFSCFLSVGLVARMSGSDPNIPVLIPAPRRVQVYVTLAFSVLGLVATFVFYILTAKCVCCKQCSCPQESLLEKFCGTDQQSPPCCSSSVRTKVLTVLQLCAKLLLVVASILYIVLLFTVGGGIPNSNSSTNITIYVRIGRYATAICAAWELVVICIVAVVRVCCWLYRVLRKYEEPNLWGFLEYLRFGDLQITSFLVPFGNVSLFYGDVWV